MALTNFTVPGISAATPALTATSPTPLNVQLDDLLYSPEEHQADYAPNYAGNEPFLPPHVAQQPKKSKVRKRAGTAYLPPPHQFTHYPRQDTVPQNPFNTLHPQLYQPNTRLDLQIENQRVQEINSQYGNTGQYIHDPTGDYDYEQRRNDKTRPPYNPGYADNPYGPATTSNPLSSRRFGPDQSHLNRPTTSPLQSVTRKNEAGTKTSSSSGSAPLDRPRGFTKVETGGGTGGKTQLHAILDYDDDDEYYEDVPGSGKYVSNDFTYIIYFPDFYLMQDRYYETFLKCS